MKRESFLITGHGKRRARFEPGDYLTKLAEEEVVGKTPGEIKKNICNIMHKKVDKISPGTFKIETKLMLAAKTTDLKGSSELQEFRSEITAADGVINIQKRGPKVNIYATIPFILREGKLLPFDIIELGGRKFVYSDANLAKVINAIEAIEKNPNLLDEDSSFERLDDFTNNSTDDGSLRDVLNIRNREMASSGLGLETFASLLDENLEKTASFRIVDRPMIDVITDKAMEIAREKIAEEFEKTAGDLDATSEKILQTSTVFSEFKGLPWVNVTKLENTSAQILDFDRGRENLELKDARVFKGRALPLPSSWDGKTKATVSTSDDITIIDKDGNYKVLRPKTDIYKEYKVVNNTPDFRPAMKSLSDLVSEGVIKKDFDKKFFILEGEQLFGPLKIHTKDSITSDMGMPIALEENPQPKPMEADQTNPFKGLFFEVCSEVLPGDRPMFNKSNRSSNFTAVLNKNKPVLTFASEEESFAFLENIYKTDEEMNLIRNNLEGNLFWISENTQLIEIADQIITPVTDIKQIILEGTDGDLRKIAGNDKVTLRKPIADKNMYFLELSKGPRDRKVYRSIKKHEAIAIMKNAGIEESEVIGMIGYLDSGEREVVRFLPIDLTRLTGSDVKVEGENIAGKFLGKYFNPREASRAVSTIVNETGKEALADKAAEGILRVGPNAIKALETITSLASDAEALADRFEKVAIDHKSRDFQNIAKMMVVTSRIDKFLAKTAGEMFSYDVSDSFDGLKGLKEPIEKAAAMLVDLKDHQDVVGNEILGRNTIVQSLRTLDRLNKYASNKAIGER